GCGAAGPAGRVRARSRWEHRGGGRYPPGEPRHVRRRDPAGRAGMKTYDEPTDDPRWSGSYGDGVRFSISIHQYDETGFDSAGLRDYLKPAQEHGVERGWGAQQEL